MAVSVKIKIDLNGTDEKLQELAKKMDDLRVPLTRSATYMESSVAKRFREAPWTPLSEWTIKMHPHRAGGKPLNDRGRLKKSVTASALKRVSKRKLMYGTNLVYAPLHNFGGQTKFGYVPQREFLYFDEKDEDVIKRIFEDYIKELSGS